MSIAVSWFLTIDVLVVTLFTAAAAAAVAVAVAAIITMGAALIGSGWEDEDLFGFFENFGFFELVV